MSQSGQQRSKRSRSSTEDAHPKAPSEQENLSSSATVNSLSYWKQSLLHKTKNVHHGVPVGAVIIAASHAQTFRNFLEKVFPSKLRVPSRVLRVGPPGEPNDRQSEPLVVMNLPPEAVCYLTNISGGETGESRSPTSTKIQEMMKVAPVVFLPCVRQYEPILLPRHLCEKVFDSSGRPYRSPDRGTVGGEKTAPLFKFAEVFAGVGGFRVGLEQIGGKCTFACEMDPAASDTYRLNWPDDIWVANSRTRRATEAIPSPPQEVTSVLVESSILDVPEDMIPNFDILTGGFPCQTFSQRGTQAGADPQGSDWRGSMYLELVRLLRACRPKAFIFENVVNLVVMDGGEALPPTHRGETTSFSPGKVFSKMLEAFGASGYDVSWQVLNARHHLPQYRERVYIVGLRQDLSRRSTGCSMDWSGLKGSHENVTGGCVRDILEDPNSPSVEASTLNHGQWEVLQTQMNGRGQRLSDRAIPLSGKAPTLIGSYHKVTNITSKYICEERDGTLRGGAGSEELRPRFLTPRECARLMGFPEQYRIPDDAFHTGFYRQMGNAVCPPLIAEIGKRVLSALLCEETADLGDE